MISETVFKIQNNGHVHSHLLNFEFRASRLCTICNFDSLNPILLCVVIFCKTQVCNIFNFSILSNNNSNNNNN